MSLNHVLKEIYSVTAFFQSHGEAEGDASVLQKSFADGVLNKLKIVKDFGPGDGAQLHEALKQSLWTEPDPAHQRLNR